MSKPLQGALLVEGKGEQDAMPALMKALWRHLGLAPFVEWTVELQSTQLKDPVYLARQMDRPALRNGRYQALLVVYDSDDKKPGGQLMCPKTQGPLSAQVIRAAKLPIPAAVVLAWKEYEHWLLASMPQWAGRSVIDPVTRQTLTTVLPTAASAHADLHHRDAKDPLARRLAINDYNPTKHQRALTAMLDFAYLQKPEVEEVCPSFGNLWRAAQFLATTLQQPVAAHVAQVYPPASPKA